METNTLKISIIWRDKKPSYFVMEAHDPHAAIDPAIANNWKRTAGPFSTMEEAAAALLEEARLHWRDCLTEYLPSYLH